MVSSISCGTRFFNTGFLRLISCSQFAALVVELLEAVEAVAAVAHHLAGLADIAELLRKLQQANLGTDDLLFSRHDVLQCRGGALRHPDRSAPCLGLRFAVGIGHRCQIKFWLMHLMEWAFL